MSTPASFRMGPGTTNAVASKRYFIIHLLIIYISSLLPLIIMGMHFSLYESSNKTNFYLLLPIRIFGLYILWVFMAILTAAIFLKIVKWIHPPREGYFKRDNKDKDYRYWTLRATIKKFAIWLSHNFWLPWLDLIAFKLFGVKITSKTAVFDAWVDTEFVEIGKNVTIGQGAVVLGTMVTRDWLICQKTIIENDVVVGGYSVISPGTHIHEYTILGAASSTFVGQELESGNVYLGSPAKKFKENKRNYDAKL